MKTLCFLFLAFIYLLPGCSSADNTPPSRAPATDHGYTAAREAADALEEQYGVTVPDEKLAAFERVSDVVALLEEQKVKA